MEHLRVQDGGSKGRLTREKGGGGALAVALPRSLLEWDFIEFLFWMFKTTGQKPLPRRKEELIFVRQK